MSDFNLEDLFNIGHGTKDVEIGKHTFSLRTLTTTETGNCIERASIDSFYYEATGVVDKDGNPEKRRVLNEVTWAYSTAKWILNQAITNIDGKSTNGIDLKDTLDSLHTGVLMQLYRAYQDLESEVEETVATDLKK